MSIYDDFTSNWKFFTDGGLKWPDNSKWLEPKWIKPDRWSVYDDWTKSYEPHPGDQKSTVVKTLEDVIAELKGQLSQIQTRLLKVQDRLSFYEKREKEEKKLRKQYPTLEEAWNSYQLALKLVKDHDDKK